MAKKPPDPPGDIPAWVMTFSDVITLLMTFFILLLTFSSMEPEAHRDMMQTILPGSMGVASNSQSPNPKDAVLFRQRSYAGRTTNRGSEMPPVNTAPTLTAMNKGLAGLTDDEKRELSTTHTLRFPWSALVDGEGKLTNVGKQRLRMLAFQVFRQDLTIKMRIGSVTKFDYSMEVYEHLISELGVKFYDIGVGRDENIDRDFLHIDITKRYESTSHGA